MKLRRNPSPTRAQARTLIALIPRLEQLPRVLIEVGSDGVPTYEAWFLEFIRLASQDCFLHWDYSPDAADAVLIDVRQLDWLDFPSWSAVWTRVVRAERFIEGSWNQSVRSGVFARLLWRLEVLLPEFEEG
jgi:Family of unknown function (DUF6508)